jgi:hypothetical protein
MLCHALQKEKLTSVFRAMARVLREVATGNWEVISKAEGPSPKKEQLAKTMAFLSRAPNAVAALASGRLLSPGGSLVQGEVWLGARVRQERLAKLLRIKWLGVIMPEEALAESLTQAAYMENHNPNYRNIGQGTRGGSSAGSDSPRE